jgi:hypothetical protein
VVSQPTGLAHALLAALTTVPGLRPAPPVAVPSSTSAWVSRNLDLLAVDVGEHEVRVRLVASRLPLPPLLTLAETVLRAVLVANARPGVRLRLEVIDLDGGAFTRSGETGAT